MATKLIIDTDPGIDDAMAISYAIANPEIDLLGLTTVFGNVTTPQATRNALFLIEVANVNVCLFLPVCISRGHYRLFRLAQMCTEMKVLGRFSL